MKLMTLNLNLLADKHGSWEVRRERIIATISEIAPDIVALQAVRRLSSGQDQAQELASCLPELPFPAFIPGANRPDGTADGSAFLSRLPPEAVDSFQLTAEHPDDRTPRLVLVGRFRVAKSRLIIVNCHFSWIADQALQNVEETLARLDGTTPAHLMAGDMNSTPDTVAMRRLAQAGWRDAWHQLRSEEPGWTFESDRPAIRIDYIWTNPSLGARANRVETVGDSGSRLSDHLGLYADIEL